MRIQAPRGTNDVLPSSSARWATLEQAFRDVSTSFGYREIRTPTFEDTNLFARSAGETSDVVTKEMYSFLDRGDRSITLKPEGTAGALRAVIEHNLYQQGVPLRLFYVTPIFRYERPQKGRYREAHQFGLELLGSTQPTADAEIIEATVRFYELVGLNGVVVSINCLGGEVCRAKYRAALLEYAQTYMAGQSPETQERILRNPLRLLDFKDPEAKEAMRGAPIILDFLEEDSLDKFKALQGRLKSLQIAFDIRPDIVRGLDYYNQSIFEVESADLGAQSSLCGGGRYDGLIKKLGGADVPAVGVGLGIERTLLAIEAKSAPAEDSGVDVYMVSGESASEEALIEVAKILRSQGWRVTADVEGKSVKSQMKTADKMGARHAALIGVEDADPNDVVWRDLSTGEQTTYRRTDLTKIIRL